jgi:hypothetical protein
MDAAPGQATICCKALLPSDRERIMTSRFTANERQRTKMATPRRALESNDIRELEYCPTEVKSVEARIRRPLTMLLKTKHHSMEAGSAARLRMFFRRAEKNYRSISWPLGLRKFFHWAGF